MVGIVGDGGVGGNGVLVARAHDLFVGDFRDRMGGFMEASEADVSLRGVFHVVIEEGVKGGESASHDFEGGFLGEREGGECGGEGGAGVGGADAIVDECEGFRHNPQPHVTCWTGCGGGSLEPLYQNLV